MRYAVRALIQLAHHQKAGPISVRRMGNQEALSDKYLESVLAQLKAAGIVASRKGKHGGYVLARSADQISLLDIVRVFDAGIVIEEESSHSDTPVWSTVRAEFEATLDRITLAEAAESALQQRQALHYSI